MKTKDKILKAALSVFIEKGFAGSSISDIAQKTKINQSLIYHHFKNKEALWKAVKLKALEGEESTPQDFQSFYDFLVYIINQRLEIYDRNPHLVRLMQWQALEEKHPLQGGNPASPQAWLDAILMLQDKGLVRKDYDAQVILIFIFSTVQALIQDNLGYFKNNPGLKITYKQMLIREVEQIFGCGVESPKAYHLD